MKARATAGPEDARMMVGKDFGGLRVVNDVMGHIRADLT